MQQLVKIPLGPVTGYAIVPTCALVLLIGYELYLKREYIVGKWYCFIGGLLTYLLIHIALFKCQMLLYYRDINARHVFSWDSTFAIIGALSLCICIMSIKINIKIIQNIICFIADKTYYIYLIHIVTFFKLDGRGVRKWLQDKYCRPEYGFWGELAYTVGYVLIIFIVSLVVVSIIKWVMFGIKKLFGLLICKIKQIFLNNKEEFDNI